MCDSSGNIGLPLISWGCVSFVNMVIGNLWWLYQHSVFGSLESSRQDCERPKLNFVRSESERSGAWEQVSFHGAWENGDLDKAKSLKRRRNIWPGHQHSISHGQQRLKHLFTQRTAAQISKASKLSERSVIDTKSPQLFIYAWICCQSYCTSCNVAYYNGIRMTSSGILTVQWHKMMLHPPLEIA